MLRLYPDLHFASGDYAELAEACKSLIWDTALQILSAGTDVVLDWNQWSRERRAVWAGKAQAAGAAVVVHYVRTPLQTSIERAAARAAGARRARTGLRRQTSGTWPEFSRNRNRRRGCGSCPDTGRLIR